jgi:hypothetical protein
LRNQYQVKRVHEDSTVEHPVDDDISNKTLFEIPGQESSEHGYPLLKLVDVDKVLESIGDAPVFTRERLQHAAE